MKLCGYLLAMLVFEMPALLCADPPRGGVYPGDLLYVEPVGGLAIYDQPSMPGRVVTRIEMGTPLKVLEVAARDSVAGLDGVWVRVAKGTSFFGYVFSRYSSHAVVFLSSSGAGQIVFFASDRVSYAETQEACMPDCHTSSDCRKWFRTTAYGTWEFADGFYRIEWKHHERRVVDSCGTSDLLSENTESLEREFRLVVDGQKDYLVDKHGERKFQRKRP